MSEQPCDCDMTELVAEYNTGERYFLHFIKWDDNFGWLYCKRHHVHVGIEGWKVEAPQAR